MSSHVLLDSVVDLFGRVDRVCYGSILSKLSYSSKYVTQCKFVLACKRITPRELLEVHGLWVFFCFFAFVCLFV